MSAEIDVFLNQLTEESIDRAIACFKDGIHSRKVLPSDFDTRNAHLTCDRIIRLTTKMSIARTLIYQIPKFWFNLNGLIQSSNLNAIEAGMTRVFCIQGAWRFHKWLLRIVPAAVDHTSRTTWIDKLASDVSRATEQGRSVIFRSADYLPGLDIQREYTIQAMPFRFDQRDLVISNMSSILRHWLYFPTDEASLVQLSLIDIVANKSPMSILFLDAVWAMYKTPFSTIFNQWNARTSKPKMDRFLTEFEKRYNSHPFATPGSMAYQKLGLLGQIIQRWMDMDHNLADIVS